MSTRALYTFKDLNGSYTVYKHHDGYPEGAASWLTKALKLAWPLPRFEADEFAAAFVAANKEDAGGIRLLPDGQTSIPDMWQEYHYTISLKNDELWIECDQFKATLDGMVKEFGAPYAA